MGCMEAWAAWVAWAAWGHMDVHGTHGSLPTADESAWSAWVAWAAWEPTFSRWFCSLWALIDARIMSWANVAISRPKMRNCMHREQGGGQKVISVTVHSSTHGLPCQHQVCCQAVILGQKPPRCACKYKIGEAGLCSTDMTESGEKANKIK